MPNGTKPKLLVVTTVPNTITSILKGQLRWLCSDFEVSIATSPDKERFELIKEAEGITPHTVPMARQISPLADAVSIFRMIRLFRRERPDIVHSYTPKAGLVAAIAGRVTGVPVRIHTFTGLIFPTATGFKQKMLIAVDRLICASVTHVVPEGEGVKTDLEQFKITKKPMKLIGNGNIAGIDITHFDPQDRDVVQEAATLRAQWNIPKDAKVITFIGRLNRDKGLDELFAAYQTASQTHPNTYLLCLGHYDDTAPLKAETHAALSDHPNVILPGFLSDIRPSLKLSDVVILPSYREGFPNVLLQASAMEVPVIATNISGCNEIVKEGETGWLVPVKDAASLARAIMDFLQHSPEARKTIGEAGRRRVATLFERDAFRQNLLAFYKSAMGPLKPRK